MEAPFLKYTHVRRKFVNHILAIKIPARSDAAHFCSHSFGQGKSQGHSDFESGRDLLGRRRTKIIQTEAMNTRNFYLFILIF